LQEEREGLIGPVGLILCGSSKSCHRVNEMLQKLLQGDCLTTLAVPSKYDKESQRKLKDKPDFVVTTPPGAISLFNEHFDYFQFSR